jgi:hypothetical protein
MVLHFMGFQLLAVSEITIATQLLAGVFIGSALGMVGVSQYRDGKHRTALGMALFAIGVSLATANISVFFMQLSTVFLLASAGVLSSIDQRLLSLTT